MAPIDLPVLPTVDKPWVSASTTSTTTKSGTGCEKIDLKKSKSTKNKSLTYVTPDATVPPEFGLDALVAEFANPAAANAFVTGTRSNVDGCAKTNSVATVKTTGALSSGNIKGETWRVAYDTGGGKIFTYRIGLASNGPRAVYLVYPVLKNLDISNTAFAEVVTRAAERSAAYK
jgi:hypothetical protein